MNDQHAHVLVKISLFAAGIAWLADHMVMLQVLAVLVSIGAAATSMVCNIINTIRKKG